MGQAEVAIEFPVVFYNGERQITVGNITIHPDDIDFQKFRAKLKHMIGISYNNLTTYLVGRRPDNHADHRKILITSKTDFLSVLREKNAYFLVVMKRSRRDRRRKNNNRMTLGLSPEDLIDYGYDHHQITTQVLDVSDKVELWLHDLHMQRANTINFMMSNANCDFYLHANSNFPSIREAYPAVERYTSRAVCEECTQVISQGLKPVFHPCVYDEVVEGFFRTKAGPISRPAILNAWVSGF